MVYTSDYYTTRSYSTRPVVTSYSVSRKHEIPWDKVPFVPRPSLIADPITAFGNRNSSKSGQMKKPSILDPINRASIKPSAQVLLQPIKPYISAREQTRHRVLNMVRNHVDTVEAGGNTAACTFRDSMDILLPRLHKTQERQLHHNINFREPSYTY